MSTHVDLAGALFVVWGVLTTLIGLSTLALGVGATALAASAAGVPLLTACGGDESGGNAKEMAELPDGVRRGLVGEVIRRFEARGLRLAALKHMSADRGTVESHYAEHREKPFFGAVVDYLTSGPIVVMAIEGENAIKACRAMMGATNPAEAAPGTIRGDFALTIDENVVHGSADPDAAMQELQVWFPNLSD